MSDDLVDDSSDPSAVTPERPVVVYVSNADSGDISVLRLDRSTGAMEPLQTVAVGGMVMPMALSPDRRVLYAARRSEPFAVVTFSIDPDEGRLRRAGEAALPHSMACIATDRSGRFLFGASYGGNLISVSPIGVDGIAQAMQQVVPTPPHAHAIQSDPSNRFVFATSLGGDVVLAMRFDPTTGMLAPNAPDRVAMRAGSGPRHFVFSADSRFVYLLNELDATLDVLAFDAATGDLQPLQTVQTLPAGFVGAPWAADLHLTPDGRFLYSSERRSSTLAAFAVDASTGCLAPIRHVAVEAQPRGFEITPDGRFLLVAGQSSHRLGCFAIDPSTGRLSRIGDCAVGLNPNWVEIVDLSRPLA